MKKTLFLLSSLLLLAACNRENTQTLSIIAGSELKDLEPLFPDLERAVGVKLSVTYSGTLEGAERIAAGEKFDLAWFSHGKYLALSQPDKVRQQEKLMLSPVVLGVKTSRARSLGWAGKPVSWKTIAAAASSGKFRFAMTNPAASNSGFTALMGLSEAFGTGSDALLKDFFKGQTLTAGSSGYLSDAFVRDQSRLDGMVNYESVLLGLNSSGKLNEKLSLIYPEEGVVTADYPLTLLEPDKKEIYLKVVDYFKKKDVQERIVQTTLRRPVDPTVNTGTTFPTTLINELPFPRSSAQMNTILGRYLSSQRRPAYAVFVLDVSGSMGGDRMSALKDSITRLAGADSSLTGQLSSFQTREKIALLTFSSTVNPPQFININSKQDREQVKSFARGLNADGGTNIYGALEAAYGLLETERNKYPGYNFSVVLMTDGENNGELKLRDFQSFYGNLPSSVRGVRTFPIVFGEGNKGEMGEIANITGGRVFDGQKSLQGAFKEIRGYQ